MLVRYIESWKEKTGLFPIHETIIIIPSFCNSQNMRNIEHGDNFRNNFIILYHVKIWQIVDLFKKM